MRPPQRLVLLAYALLLIVSVAPVTAAVHAAQPRSATSVQTRAVPLGIAADNPERPPYNLATRALSNTSIRVTWNNASYIDGFRLYRWNGSAWQLIRERFTNTWYDDTNLTPGTTYHYSVCSYYGSKTMCASGYTSGSTTSAAPAAPNALWTTTRSSTSIRFGWNQPCWSQPCIPVNTYRIYRQQAGSSTFEMIASGFGQMRTFDDTDLRPNTEYYYTVCADGDSGSTCAATWQRGKTY